MDSLFCSIDLFIYCCTNIIQVLPLYSLPGLFLTIMRSVLFYTIKKKTRFPMHTKTLLRFLIVKTLGTVLNLHLHTECLYSFHIYMLKFNP
jgi:hypothetical protein